MNLRLIKYKHQDLIYSWREGPNTPSNLWSYGIRCYDKDLSVFNCKKLLAIQSLYAGYLESMIAEDHIFSCQVDALQ